VADHGYADEAAEHATPRRSPSSSHHGVTRPEPVRGEHGLQRTVLRSTHLDQQPASGTQQRPGGRDDPADELQTVGPPSCARGGSYRRTSAGSSRTSPLGT
jgi:hypothetical protein